MLRELVTILDQPLQAGWHPVKTAGQFVFPFGMDYLQKTLDEQYHLAVGFADHRPVTMRPYDWTVLEVSGVYAGRTGAVNLAGTVAGTGCVTTGAVDSAVAARKVVARIAKNAYHTTCVWSQ